MSAIPAVCALKKSKMNKKKLIAGLMLLLLLNGKTIAMPSNTSCEFTVGQTNQEQVRADLGDPNVTAEGDRGEIVWVFNNIGVACFIDTEVVPADQLLILKFDDGGVLIDYEIRAQGENTE